MEHMLKCNSMKCRKELTDKALVTTCSHIFCTDCATRLGLTDSSARHSCPACNVPLTNPDDAVVTNLNPSEDYKTSVLSGLSPNAIIECTSRALSFWAYQTVQEVVYHNHIGKTLTEKYTDLTVHLDKVIGDANTQIAALNNKIGNLDLDHQALRRKNDDLAQAFREKNKKLMQTQELYDKLKRKAMMGQMQHAAEDAVDSNLHSTTFMGDGALGLGDGRDTSNWYQETGDGLQQPTRPQLNTQGSSNMYSTQASDQQYPGAWNKRAGGGDVPFTPSTHRQRIGGQLGNGIAGFPGLSVPANQTPRPGLNARSALSDMPGNFKNTGKFPAVGLSSGLKSSHHGGGHNEFVMPAPMIQVQRPTPNMSNTGQATTQRPDSVLGGFPGIARGLHAEFVPKRR